MAVLLSHQVRILKRIYLNIYYGALRFIFNLPYSANLENKTPGASYRSIPGVVPSAA